MAIIDLDKLREPPGDNNPWAKGKKTNFGGGGNSGGGLPKIPGGMFGILGLLAILAIILLLKTGLYTVPSDSIGVVTRFGEYSSEQPAGLHWKLPWGVDDVTIVPVKRQLKQEFGFATQGATNPSQARVNTLTEQKQMVTGDLNAALVEWVIQYRIEDPKKYLFDVRNPAETLRDLSESVMRAVVGDRTVDEVITIGRQEIEDEALVKMQDLTEKYGIGVSIDQVQLKNINPPRPVQESFNEVNQAQQEKESLINAARREYNKVIPLAEGEKDQRIRAADGYRLKRINEAEGDASRFTAVFEEYKKAPEVTRRRIYIETLQEVLPDLESKIIVDENSQQVLPLINLTNQKEVISLKMKIPFIQQVNPIEKRILEWDGNPSNMPTKDKLYIAVDLFARWRITDPLQYFLRLRDERSAQSRLDDILGSETRNAVAKHELIEIIRTTKDRKPVRDASISEEDLATLGSLVPIRKGRTQVEKEIFSAAAKKVEVFGIELLDIRFKRINYNESVRPKIYERMISERRQIAERFRSEGNGEAARINGLRERDLNKVRSEAYKEVEEIRGAADAKATEIYADAYNSSDDARDFYEFQKTMDMYKSVIKNNTTLMLSTQSEAFKFLNGMSPE